MLSFFGPGFALAGLLAAVGPLLIHLLNRRRHRRIHWAAMEFLREALERNRRFLEVRDLLLLFLRTGCVVLFGLAMARPYFSSPAGPLDPHQPIHAILIVDNSLSMGYQKLEGTLLDEAKKRAAEVIERAPAGSRISVLPLCGSALAFSRDGHRTREDALKALSAIEVVDRSGSALQAAELALLCMKKEEDLPSKRVLFIGDQQRIDWPGSMAEKLRELPDMEVVQVGAEEPENGWVADFRLEDGVADTETPAVFLATVRYQGPAARRGVEATLTIDGQAVASQTFDLEPSQSRELTFSHRFEVPTEPGQVTFVRAVLSLTPDRLPADDRRFLAAPVVAALPVVFVDQAGEDEDPQRNRYGETFRLRRLLAPVTAKGGGGRQLVQVRRKRIDQLERETLADCRLVVIAGVESPARAVPLLREYLEQGGQLVIAAGAGFDPKAWSETAWLGGAGILPAPLDPQPIGLLPEEAPELVVPFQLDPRSLVGDCFLIDQVSREELDDLYREPLFFKAARADAGPKVVEGLLEAETRRIEEERRAAAAWELQRKRWAEEESKASLPEAERARRAEEIARRAALKPAWLAWAGRAKEPERELSAAELALETRPRVLGSYTSGAPFLIERKVGRGQVAFISTGVHSNWSTLTRTNAALVFDRIFRACLERTLPERNRETVERILLPIEPQDQKARFLLERPGQPPEPMAAEALGADLFGVAIRRVTQRGFYSVSALPGSGSGRPETPGSSEPGARPLETVLAVNGPAGESDLRALDQSGFQKLLGGSRSLWVGRGEPITLEGTRVRGQGLWRWLVFLMLGCLLLEMGVLARPVLSRERVS
jgi:hypothetical protein